MMAILERYDMPTNMFGVTGLNPWNLIFLSILIAYYFDINRRKYELDLNPSPRLPLSIRGLIITYLVVLIISTAKDVGRREWN